MPGAPHVANIVPSKGATKQLSVQALQFEDMHPHSNNLKLISSTVFGNETAPLPRLAQQSKHP